MKKYDNTLIFAFVMALVAGVFPAVSFSQPSGKTGAPSVLVSPLLRSGSFVEGSVFEVPIVLDTKGSSVQGIDVRIDFDEDKLAIMQQSNGLSIIGKWSAAPSHDNTNGTASYVGIVPEGIKTGSGVIGVITFKALREGRATVAINGASRITLKDGLDTTADLKTEKGEYAILRALPDGIYVFSATHPDQNNWYNNTNPTISWEANAGSEGFSYVLDNKPNTIPNNAVKTKDTAITIGDLKDGLWYFHIKEKKGAVWSAASHFLIRIDTVPPLPFVPEVKYWTGSAILSEWIPVSFFTTDNLSGIDHYEVGVADRAAPVTASPSFIQSESPFLVPLQNKDSQLRVAVRAIDKAGNVRDATIAVEPMNQFAAFIRGNFARILFDIILMTLEAAILYYFFRHRLSRRFRRIMKFAKQEKQIDEILEKQDGIDEELYKTIVARETFFDKEKINSVKKE